MTDIEAQLLAAEISDTIAGIGHIATNNNRNSNSNRSNQ